MTLLCGILLADIRTQSPVYDTQVRLTYYTLQGITRYGGEARLGVAACGASIAPLSVIEFEDGMRVVCEDSGYLLPNGVDVWVPSYSEGNALINRYGEYPLVRVYDNGG